MTAVIKQWGDSIGLCLPKQLVRAASLQPGATFNVDVEPGGALRLEPVLRRPTLDDLCARITDENRHPATDWGPVKGREAW